LKNQVQLIAYVDRAGGGDLADLRRLLQTDLPGVFGGVHLLPFFHPIDGADAGFDPIDHTRVDPRLGTWADVGLLARDAEVMADLIVNHVSSSSPQFRDFAAHGLQSPFARMFLTYDRVFPQGATAAELLQIYRPRPGLPFTSLTVPGGQRHLLWTTFTPQQIDLDVADPQGRAYLEGIIETFRAAGVSSIRLDAVGYAVKRAGTRCFMIPETYAFIAELTAKARAAGLEVLVEIHSYYADQIEIARHVDRVYDFALPPLVLHALQRADAAPLTAWLAQSPRNAITVLDTHDGIGVIDVGADAATGRPGLLSPPQIDELVETIHRASRGESRKATGAAASNLDLYQVNCTYYDALGRDDWAYLAARAIQFFAPGIPQVYYVGLLAGGNDLALLAQTGVGRDINRHRYTREEIAAALGRPVVRELIELIRFRNRHPAFGGTFAVVPSDPQIVALRWTSGADWAHLTIDLSQRRGVITAAEAGVTRTLPLLGSSLG